MKKIFIRILFVMYLLVLIYILFLNNKYRYNFHNCGYTLFSSKYLNLCNFIPFRNIYRFMYRIFISKYNIIVALRNLFVNIVLLLPLGIFLPLLNKLKFNNIKNITKVLFIFSLTIELVQFITLTGVFDIDDILINIIGGILGYFIYKVIDNIVEKRILKD